MTGPAARLPRISGPDDLAAAFDLTAQTRQRLEVYAGVLTRWQRAVNLVAPNTLPEIWHRHFADSLQLARLIPNREGALADLGSGAGFPGLVLAAHFHDQGGPRVILVESDQRKAAFLREAARAMEISVEILSTRIESDANLARLSCVDFVTARALAPLPRLFSLVCPFLSPAAVCIFLKGRSVAREIEEARETWSFALEEHPSLTEDEASILMVRAIRPRSGTGQQTE